MSKKHYEALAHALSGAEGPEAIGLVLKVADVLAADNPRFDRDYFLAACGL